MCSSDLAAGASRSSLASAIKPTELIETVGAAVGALPTSRSCASDSVLVNQQMGSGNYSAHGMRQALERLGAPEVNPDANAAPLSSSWRRPSVPRRRLRVAAAWTT